MNDDEDADVVVAAAVEDVDDVLYILTTSGFPCLRCGAGQEGKR